MPVSKGKGTRSSRRHLTILHTTGGLQPPASLPISPLPFLPVFAIMRCVYGQHLEFIFRIYKIQTQPVPPSWVTPFVKPLVRPFRRRSGPFGFSPAEKKSRFRVRERVVNLPLGIALRRSGIFSAGPYESLLLEGRDASPAPRGAPASLLIRPPLF